MNLIKQTALKYFALDEKVKCRCGGSHEICLQCKICRADDEDMRADKNDDLAGYIDHTILKPHTVRQDVERVCLEAKSYNFKSVCINPIFVSLAYTKLKRTGSLVCSVVGFPLGANLSEVKGEEALNCIRQGAEEIDMVNNITALKEKDIATLLNDIATVSDICLNKDAILKVIIETCLLTEEEKIIACLAAKKEGALFVKTSTGFSTGGATIEDVTLMKKIVGPKFGVKASGGIKTAETARAMIEAGANRIGTSSGVEIVKAKQGTTPVKV
jgi:deoxyribose-phosphate aldolase